MSGAPGVERVYPATYQQESMWLDDLVCDGQSRCLESWVYRLTGQLDTGAIEWAVNQVIARHEILRSRLTAPDGKLMQIVTTPASVPLAQVSCSPAELSAELMRITAEPLDLDETPFRPWLICLSPNEFVLVMQFHHAVVDDWALDVFQRELTHLYTCRVLDRASSLRPLPMQAGDFAIAQRAVRIDPTDLAYWRERVVSAPERCAPPTDCLGPEELPHCGGQQLFEVGPGLGHAVRVLSRARRTTPYSVFAAALAVLLWEYGDNKTVIFGTPVSQRGVGAVDSMICCLSEVFPLRLAVFREISFSELVEAAKGEVIGTLEHRFIPRSELTGLSRIAGDADVPSLFNVVLVVDDMRWEPLLLPGITAERIFVQPRWAKFDMMLTLVAGDDGGYAGFCDYDADVYHADTMTRAASRFTTLLARLLAGADEHLAQVVGSSAEHSRG